MICLKPKIPFPSALAISVGDPGEKVLYMQNDAVDEKKGLLQKQPSRERGNSQHTAHLAASSRLQGGLESSPKPADTGLKEDMLWGASQKLQTDVREAGGPGDHTDIGVGGPDPG